MRDSVKNLLLIHSSYEMGQVAPPRKLFPNWTIVLLEIERRILSVDWSNVVQTS